jgi:hypothetical protein
LIQYSLYTVHCTLHTSTAIGGNDRCTPILSPSLKPLLINKNCFLEIWIKTECAAPATQCIVQNYLFIPWSAIFAKCFSAAAAESPKQYNIMHLAQQFYSFIAAMYLFELHLFHIFSRFFFSRKEKRFFFCFSPQGQKESDSGKTGGLFRWAETRDRIN